MPGFARLQLRDSPARLVPSPRTPTLLPLLSVGVTYSYLVKTFVYDYEEYVVVELYTNGRPVDAFRILVPEARNGVKIATMLPNWFFESNRMIREKHGTGTNESFVQAQEDIVQIARGMFGHEGPLAPPQFIPHSQQDPPRFHGNSAAGLQRKGRDAPQRRKLRTRAYL